MSELRQSAINLYGVYRGDSGRENPFVAAGGLNPRSVASYAIAADSNAFSDGDVIANSTSAASVVPIIFDVGSQSGEIVGCRCAFGPASSTVVTTNLAFDLLLFRPTPSVPFAAAGYPASNAALAYASLAAALAATEQLLCVIEFLAGTQSAQSQAGGTGWRSYGSGKVGYQRGLLPTGVNAAPFNLEEYASTTINGLMVARAAWNNGNVANTFKFALDIRGNG